MRLWSLHPKYLDTKGLVALWRETLLAKHVLAGKTKGYKNHPQLDRFKRSKNPVETIDQYMADIYAEASNIGYNFDKKKINRKSKPGKLAVTTKQLAYEFDHLLKKLQERDSKKYNDLRSKKIIDTHPMFTLIEGGIEKWEILPGNFNNKKKEKMINKDIRAYNAAQESEDKKICNLLSMEINSNLPGAENKIWHAHPVWFLDGNPIVGYSKLKNCVRLLFWSGQSFDEEALHKEGSFKAAEVRYTAVDEVNVKDLKRWLKKSKTIQWDYKNLIKRKGVLERLK